MARGSHIPVGGRLGASPARWRRTATLFICALLVAGVFLAACGAAQQRQTDATSRSSSRGTRTPVPVAHPTVEPRQRARASARSTTAPPTTAPPTAARHSSVEYAFLAISASEVSFLQFYEQPGNGISGSDYSGSLSGSPPYEVVDNQTTIFSGTIAGAQLKFKFKGRYAYVHGELTGNALLLQVTQSDGGLAEVTYNKATPAQYAHALAALETTVQEVNSEAATPASVTGAQQQRVQQEQQWIDRASETVASDAKDLTVEGPGTISDDLADLDDDLGTVSNGLGVAQGDYGAFRVDLASNTNACGNIRGLDQDAREVANDGAQLLSDAHGELLPDVGSLQQSMASAKGDWAAYWQAQAVLPRYQPSGAVPPLSPTLAAAQAAIAGAINQGNSDIDQANRIVGEADALANKADRTAHCGQPASPSVPLPHIAAP